MSNQSTRCPRCGELGKKVSGIHDGGISVERRRVKDDDGFHKWKNVTVQTELSRKLAPPNKPGNPKYGTCLIWMLTVLVYPFLMAGMVFTGMLLDPKNWVLSTFAYAGIADSVVVLYFLIVAWEGRRAKREYEQYGGEKWEEAMKRWEVLYYCSSDDGVFFPGQNRFAPLNLMIKFLYWGL